MSNKTIGERFVGVIKEFSLDRRTLVLEYADPRNFAVGMKLYVCAGPPAAFRTESAGGLVVQSFSSEWTLETIINFERDVAELVAGITTGDYVWTVEEEP